ncbi:Hypothetical protein FKW44_000247 [Caligus rogercresseyi]|uniref:Uncharacterized protein n=1 Tax=Caligus rogercresseyi TaxID=217165 RepID=A0A7T8KH58_CALRO|nr:Hypothetical protein FKW44_000247 [Caligus rogercresseyi]
MDPQFPSNTIRVFWGYKSRQWPLSSAKPIGVFWGYKSTANGRSDSAKHN